MNFLEKIYKYNSNSNGELVSAYCNFRNRFNIGKQLGCGADGVVFELNDIFNKVIKICFDDNDDSVRSIMIVLSYLSDKQPLTYARVYEYGTIYKEENNIIHYHVMEKLQPITEDESKVFRSILSHEDRSAKKNYSYDQVLHMLIGMQLGLDFDRSKVLSFYSALKECELLHNDIHERNIMKNNIGDFKLIDFNRLEKRNV